MKELYLIRHAKSDWGTEFLMDIDRPLNDRGYGDAYALSKWLTKNKNIPDKILSSTATRALNTALIFARTMEFNMRNFELNENIYECSVARLKSIVAEQDNSFRSLMIFCHNPCVTSFCNETIEDFFIDNVPTCGIIQMQFDTGSWKDILTQKAKAVFYQFPKDFRQP